MKLYLLFPNLFIVTLVLLSPVTKAKTKPHNSIKKSFPTGTFYESPTLGMVHNPNATEENEWVEPTPISKFDPYYKENENRITIKKLGSSNRYNVSFSFTMFASHLYSCAFNGIFEQKTAKKLLILADDDKSKKYCSDLAINAYGEGIAIYAQDSCRKFCDLNNSMEFNFSFKKETKRKIKEFPTGSFIAQYPLAQTKNQSGGLKHTYHPSSTIKEKNKLTIKKIANSYKYKIDFSAGMFVSDKNDKISLCKFSGVLEQPFDDTYLDLTEKEKNNYCDDLNLSINNKDHTIEINSTCAKKLCSIDPENVDYDIYLSFPLR